jgi:hypothetical protein
MSEWTKQAIAARERRTRGEPEQGTYRDLQETAKTLGIPANQSAADLEKAIAAKRDEELGGDDAEA